MEQQEQQPALLSTMEQQHSNPQQHQLLISQHPNSSLSSGSGQGQQHPQQQQLPPIREQSDLKLTGFGEQGQQQHQQHHHHQQQQQQQLHQQHLGLSPNLGQSTMQNSKKSQAPSRQSVMFEPTNITSNSTRPNPFARHSAFSTRTSSAAGGLPRILPITGTKGGGVNYDEDNLLYGKGGTSMMSMSSQNNLAQSQPGYIDGPNIFAHLPDIVIMAGHNRPLPNQTSVQAVVMFLDISGFTALCETYSHAGYGIDQLTKTLNTYIGALVAEILSSDGDILKFAGDAILSVWYANTFESMQAAIAHVINCALVIQKKHGIFLTSANVTLKIKIGISAGQVNILLLGNEEIRGYVELGRAIVAVNLVEDFWDPGTVIVSPTAWCHCYNLNTVHTVMSDGKHVRVDKLLGRTGIADYVHQSTIAVKASLTKDHEFDTDLTIPDWIKKDKSMSAEVSLDAGERGGGDRADEFDDDQATGGKYAIPKVHRLRKAIIPQFDEKVEKALKLYLASPVLSKFEHKRSLEYLSEMRQITIVFINLNITKVSARQQAHILQSCFQVIFLCSRTVQGCVSKISLFDKGCTFLVLFGLPSLKHENECAHALMCADSIRQQLLVEMPEYIELVSIGVTTGPTYCGVVGHLHRHEYTVIGPKVNTAARFMMHYPNKITCDNETFFRSKLKKSNFVVQELKEMKGLAKNVIVREFRRIENVKETLKHLLAEEEQRPVIGRDDELEIFQKELDLFHEGDNSPNDKEIRQVILITGEAGIGRSRLLDSMIVRAFQKNMFICTSRLTLQDKEIKLKVISSLLEELIGFNVRHGRIMRENKIRSLLDESWNEHLHLLNALLQVNFPNHSVDLYDDEEVKRYEIVSELVRVIATQKKRQMVFCVDDTHLLDPPSWFFLQCFVLPNTLLILTKRCPIAFDFVENNPLLCNRPILTILLLGLQPQHLSVLACQLLGVSMIPLRFDKILREKSMGVPLWIELLLNEYVNEKIFKFEPVSKGFPLEAMVAPHPKYVTRSRKGMNLNDEEQGINLSPDLQATACVFVPGVEIDISVPGSVKGMIQARIDRLPESDQMIVKAASVLLLLGPIFSRNMLQTILPPNAMNTNENIDASFQRLAEVGFFTCATRKGTMNSYVATTAANAVNAPTCICRDRYGSKSEKPMGACPWLKFQSTFVRVTAYDMLMEDNRQKLHQNAALCLEAQARNCLQDNDQCTREKIAINFQESHFQSQATRKWSGSEPGDDSDENSSDSTVTPSDAVEVIQRKRGRQSLLVAAGKKLVKLITTIMMEEEENKKVSKVYASDSFNFDERRGEISLSTIFGMQPIRCDLREPSEFNKGEDGLIPNVGAWNSLKHVSMLYKEMIGHFMGAGMVRNVIYYLLQVASVSITLFEYKSGLNYLRKAKAICNDLKEGKNPFNAGVPITDNYVFSELEEAQMEYLIGRALLHVDDPSRAITHLNRSLHITGRNNYFFEFFNQ